MPFLETARLAFRELDYGDRDIVASILTDPQLSPFHDLPLALVPGWDHGRVAFGEERALCSSFLNGH